MRPRLLIPLVILLVMALAFAACEDDKESTDTGDGQPAVVEDDAAADDAGADDAGADDAAADDADAADDGGGDGSSATLTIGDEMWEFADYFCAFGPEETENDRVSFSSGAFGESAEGVRIQLDVSIQDIEEQGRYEGQGTIHSVTLNDVEDFENPSVSWANAGDSLGGSDSIIMIDGKSISFEGTFRDDAVNGLEEIPGTFEGSCP